MGLSEIGNVLGGFDTRVEQAPFERLKLAEKQRAEQARRDANKYGGLDKVIDKRIGVEDPTIYDGPPIDQRVIKEKTPLNQQTFQNIIEPQTDLEVEPFVQEKPKIKEPHLTHPNWDPTLESDMAKIGVSDAPGITQVNPEDTAFWQDVQKLFANSDFQALLIKIKDRASKGYNGRLAGNIAGQIKGYITDDPKQAEERKGNREAAKWYQTKEALNYFRQQPNQMLFAALDPVGWYETFKGETETRKERTLTEKEIKIIDNSTGLANKRIKSLTLNLDKKLFSKTVLEVQELARLVGVDPDLATAILAIESDFGRNIKTSSKGAKAAMQVMPETFQFMKGWFTNPANIQRYGIPEDVAKIASTLDPKQSSHQTFAGLLYLKYGEYVGVPKNLLGAGYQGGMVSVQRLGSPTQANDGYLTNYDYNRVVISVYNAIQDLKGQQGAGLNVAGQTAGGTSQTAGGTSQTAGGTGQTVTQTISPVGGPTKITSNNAGANITAQGSLKQITSNAQKEIEKEVKKGPKVDNTNRTVTSDVYLRDQTKAGRDIITMTSARERAVSVISQLNEEIARYQKLAQLARISGNLQTFFDYEKKAKDLQVQAIEIREGVIEINQKIIYLQGMQGLNDLKSGSTSRLSAVWSDYAGLDIRIIPRTDGLFDIEKAGQMYKEGASLKEVSDEAQLVFDANYRNRMAVLAAELSKENFKFNNELEKELLKIKGNITVESVKKEIELLIEKWKAGNVGFKPSGRGDGTGFVMKDNELYFFDPQKEFIKPGSKEKYYLPWLTKVDRTKINLPGGATPNPYRALFGNK